MLQVARLAQNLLHEAADNVAGFLLGQLNDNGGARDRAGNSDLYYTAFLLEGLLALQVELPSDRIHGYLASFGDGESLDPIHRACLVRCYASLGNGWPSGDFQQRVLERVERHRAADGGYAKEPGEEHGTLYHAFLANGVYQDFDQPIPDPERLESSVAGLRAADGGYADALDIPIGTTPTTAGAATLLRHLRLPVPEGVREWIVSRLHPKGGFLAVPGAPIPDLLSTATALHALSGLEVPIDGLREPTLDFIDTLWTGRGFCGHWEDDEVDCEYVFYGLLALGHLSL